MRTRPGDRGGRDSLARYVAQHHEPAAVRHLEDVVEIAAHVDGADGRDVLGGEPYAVDARQRRREQRLLQRVGRGAPLLVQLRVVERERGPPGQVDDHRQLVGIVPAAARTADREDAESLAAHDQRHRHPVQCGRQRAVLARIARVRQYALVRVEVERPPDGHGLCLPGMSGAHDNRRTAVETPEDGTPFAEPWHEQARHERHRELDLQRLREQITRTGDERDLGAPPEVSGTQPLIVDHDGEGMGAQCRDLASMRGNRLSAHGQRSVRRWRQRQRDPYRLDGVGVRGSRPGNLDATSAIGPIEHEFHRRVAGRGGHLGDQPCRELRQVGRDRGAEPGFGADQDGAIGRDKIIACWRRVTRCGAGTRRAGWAL